MDQFTETSSEGWFSRIAESFKGVLVGLLMFVCSFPLLWWNEGRAVQTAQSLDEGSGAVVSVESTNVDGGNESKLVHMSGMAATEDVLKDPNFGIEVTGIKLVRLVEMYQWTETEKKKTKKKAGGKKVTTTTYSYKQEWSKKAYDSDEFRKPKGHFNPEMLYGERTQTAQNVNLGAFTLPAEMINKISGATNLEMDDAALGKTTPTLQKQMRVENGSFYLRPAGNAADIEPGTPEVGDHRISFSLVKASDISIVAQQVGSSFRPYQTKAGDPLSMVEMGRHSAGEMFKAAQDANATLTWVLRGVGLFLMFFGVTLIFRPLVVVADVVPLFGSALSIGSMFLALIVAVPLSLITIAAAWLTARPLLGGALLAGAIAVLVGGFMMARKAKAKKAQAGMTPAFAGAPAASGSMPQPQGYGGPQQGGPPGFGGPPQGGGPQQGGPQQGGPPGFGGPPQGGPPGFGG